ncbi:sterol-sensing domain of SREBP cleavage-activation-domain-containing protein [Syncephalis plumigaleata]|nr:sterol-sensing domain of SREBP cleavage-activation-domain-containing protein [Syncephalis plumigaleata]
MTRPYLTVDTEDAALINANATTTAASTASTAASTSNIVNNASTTSRTSNIAADTSANIATSSTCKNQSLRRNIEYIFYWVGKHAAARALFYLTVSILFMFIVSYPALRAQLIRLRLHQVDQDRFWRNPVVSQTVIDHIKHEAGIGKSIHLQRFFIDLPVVDATNDTATTDILSPDQWYAAYQVELFLAQVLNNARAKNVTSCLITKSLNIKRQYNIADELCFIMGPWSNPQQMLTSQPEIAQNDSLHNYKHMLNSIIANQDEWKRSNLFDEWLEQIHRLRLPSIDEELTVGSLAGIKYDWRQQRVKAIHSIVLSYFYVTDENTSSIPSLSSVLMEKQPLGIQFTFPNTTASVPHAIKIRSHTHPLDPPIGLVMIFAVLTCVFFCASYSLGSVELVKSKNGIGFAAVLSIIFSWSMSYGFSAVLGIVYEVMPSCELHMLMVLVSCIENMFIVTNSVVSTSMDLPVAERVGRGFRAVGIPMSTGALVQIGILWMGFFFSTGALKEFCLLMVFTICYSHILQYSFLFPFYALIYDVLSLQIYTIDVLYVRFNDFPRMVN